MRWTRRVWIAVGFCTLPTALNAAPIWQAYPEIACTGDVEQSCRTPALTCQTDKSALQLDVDPGAGVVRVLNTGSVRKIVSSYYYDMSGTPLSDSDVLGLDQGVLLSFLLPSGATGGHPPTDFGAVWQSVEGPDEVTTQTLSCHAKS